MAFYYFKYLCQKSILMTRLSKIFCKKNRDRFIPYIILLIYLVYGFRTQKNDDSDDFISHLIVSYDVVDLLNLFVTVDSILIGFLITVLALTFQVETKSMTFLKTIGRFNELIKANRRAVYHCFISVLLCMVAILFPSIAIIHLYLWTTIGFFLIGLYWSFKYIRLFYKILLT